jgi:hypothetical protein
LHGIKKKETKMIEQKVFIPIDERGLISDLKNAVVEIFFQKRDGSTRFMKATLQPSYIKSQLTENRMNENANFLAPGSPTPVKVLHVWDCDEGDWRSIRLDRIFSCQLTGN